MDTKDLLPVMAALQTRPKTSKTKTLGDLDEVHKRLLTWLAELDFPDYPDATDWTEVVKVVEPEPDDKDQEGGFRVRYALRLFTTANQYLRLDSHCAPKVHRYAARVLRRRNDISPGDRYAMLGKKSLGLMLVQSHGTIPTRPISNAASWLAAAVTVHSQSGDLLVVQLDPNSRGIADLDRTRHWSERSAR